MSGRPLSAGRFGGRTAGPVASRPAPPVTAPRERAPELRVVLEVIEDGIELRWQGESLGRYQCLGRQTVRRVAGELDSATSPVRRSGTDDDRVLVIGGDLYWRFRDVGSFGLGAEIDDPPLVRFEGDQGIAVSCLVALAPVPVAHEVGEPRPGAGDRAVIAAVKDTADRAVDEVEHLGEQDADGLPRAVAVLIAPAADLVPDCRAELDGHRVEDELTFCGSANLAANSGCRWEAGEADIGRNTPLNGRKRKVNSLILVTVFARDNHRCRAVPGETPAPVAADQPGLVSLAENISATAANQHSAPDSKEKSRPTPVEACGRPMGRTV